MIRIFLETTGSEQLINNLKEKLEEYDVELFVPFASNNEIDHSSIEFEHNFNCDMVLYIMNNTINNYDLPARFIDDCWRSCIHATTLKFVGLFFVGACSDDMERSLGNVFDLGIQIAPHNLVCSFVNELQDVIKILHENKIIKLRSEADEENQNQNENNQE